MEKHLTIVTMNLSESFQVKALHYTSDQARVLKRNEVLWIEPPPEDFAPHLQYILAKTQNQISNFLANLLYQSDKHLEGFTEFQYEKVPGGAVGHVQVKTYIFLFHRPSKDGVVREFSLKKEFM